MKKVNTSNWKEFVISDLFTVKRPAARSQAHYSEGNVPFVASGNFNNGVLKYLTPKKNEQLDKGNCITVSPIDGSCFYQEQDFLGRGGAGSSIILLYNEKLNLYSGYFIATIIRTVCQKYIYNDMANKSTIGNEKIMLPVDKTGNPDFAYMESYMRNLESAVSSSLTALRSAKSSKIFDSIHTSEWIDFKITDLFDIKNTHSILKSDIREESGDTPYITASNENNGVYSYIKYDEQLIEEGNCILIGGKTLAITYQEKDFFSNDSHNLALYLKDRAYRQKHVQLFLVTAIKASIGNIYTWGNSISHKSIQKDTVKLPVDVNGNPNYAFMDYYLHGVERKVKEELDTLLLA